MVGMPARPGHRVARVHRQAVAGDDAAARDLDAAHLDRRTRASRARRRRGCGPARSRCRARPRSGGGRRRRGRAARRRHLRRPAARARSRSRARAGRSRARRRPRRPAGRRAPAGSSLAACTAATASRRGCHRPAEQEEDQPPTMKNGSFGRPGTRPIAAMTPPAIIGARGWPQDLAGDLRAEVGLAAGAGDDDARRGRDQERRDLRDEAVADRQDREGVERRRENDMPLLQHADDDAAEEVDRDDQDAGDRVALDELRGAVHRAVEVGLARDLRAALARLARR